MCCAGLPAVKNALSWPPGASHRRITGISQDQLGQQVGGYAQHQVTYDYANRSHFMPFINSLYPFVTAYNGVWVDAVNQSAGHYTIPEAIVGQWQGGFQGEVTVVAGSSSIAGWTASWTLPSGQTITQSWGATITTSGSTVTATNMSYNGSLGAGATTTFGFIGSSGTTNPVPTATCTARWRLRASGPACRAVVETRNGHRPTMSRTERSPPR